jgi:hypothetical protein
MQPYQRTQSQPMTGKPPDLFDLLREESLDPIEAKALRTLPRAGQARLVSQIQAAVANMVAPRVTQHHDGEERKEVWWIFSKQDAEWAGLRMATFVYNPGQPVVFIIHNDYGDRLGVRIWEDVSEREGWSKIERIPLPNRVVS